MTAVPRPSGKAWQLRPARAERHNDVATWRKVVAAATLDVLFALVVAEFVVRYLAGKAAKGGFELTGVSAVAVLGAVVLYFVICTRFLGGTVWQRALGLR